MADAILEESERLRVQRTQHIIAAIESAVQSGVAKAFGG